jgi:hypothetical protein
VVVPAALRDQWLDELRRRFGIPVRLVDREGLEAVASDGPWGANPWTGSGVRVASSDYLKQPHVLAAIPPIPWDLLVLDEAHDVCGSSARHAAVEMLSRRSRHVVLLTATPHSGDASRFTRLAGIGKLNGLPDPLTIFRRTRATVALPSNRRVRWARVAPSSPEVTVLEALLAFERAVLAAAATRRDAAVLLLSVLRKRALSTMSALEVSVERRLDWIQKLQGPLEGVQLTLSLDTDPGLSDDDCSALAAPIDLVRDRERAWLGRLHLLARAAVASDSRIGYVERLLRRTRATEPVVVFTEFRHSLRAVVARLSRDWAVAEIHGGQSAEERRMGLERFLSGAATILVATDVASQGLNLQHRARWIVSLELPWNPARIEQRIGRVDRIGQARPVHATLVLSRHRSESAILERLAARALTARRSLGPEALRDAVPPRERTVAEAVLCDAAAASPEPPVPKLASSRRWQRRARALARSLAHRRLLGRHWRALGEVTHRPRWTSLDAIPTLAGRLDLSNPSALIVFSLPAVDGTGRIIERRIACVAVGRFPADALQTVVQSAALRDVLEANFGPRLRRIRRLAASEAVRQIAVEEAIARDLGTSLQVGDVQPGLFDRRAERRLEGSRRTIGDIGDAAGARTRRWLASAQIELGAPAVEAILWGRAFSRADRQQATSSEHEDRSTRNRP